MRRLAILAALLCAGPLFADVKIAGPIQAPAYTVVKLTASGADAKAGLIWDITPAEKVSEADSPEGVFQFVAPPGNYAVSLLAVTVGPDGKVVIKRTKTLVQIGDPTPPPPPQPPPTPPPPPPPPPPPGQKVAWAILVEESAERTPAIGAVIGNVTGWAGLQAKGIKHLVVDKDDPAAAASGYVAAAQKAGGLPALLLLGTDGLFLRAVKLPETFAGVESEVAK